MSPQPLEDNRELASRAWSATGPDDPRGDAVVISYQSVTLCLLAPQLKPQRLEVASDPDMKPGTLAVRRERPRGDPVAVQPAWFFDVQPQAPRNLAPMHRPPDRCKSHRPAPNAQFAFG